MSKTFCGCWVRNEVWNPCEGIRGSKRNVQKNSTFKKDGEKCFATFVCTPRQGANRVARGEHASRRKSDGKVASSPALEIFI